MENYTDTFYKIENGKLRILRQNEITNISKEEILELKEKCLPQYLLNDIEEYLKYKGDKSCSFIDCLQDEIRGSINCAFVDGDIDEELAEHLRDKYL